MVHILYFLFIQRLMYLFLYYKKYFQSIKTILCIFLFINDIGGQNMGISTSRYAETTTIKVQSKVYKNERTILIKTPEEYKHTKVHYPVLYILDAHDRIKFDFYCQTIDVLVENQQLPPCYPYLFWRHGHPAGFAPAVS